MNRVLLFIICIALSSCSSYFKRQTCESTNWFEYGQNVALDGRRLTGDQFVLECQRASSDIDESLLDQGFKAGMQQYCTPSGIYKVGREGRFFNTEMCAGEGLGHLKLKHNAGVIEYCQKSNAFTAGASGQAYNKICPSELEKDFLPLFNKGRAKYLATLISQNKNQIRELEQKTAKMQSEASYKRGVLVSLQKRAQSPANSGSDDQDNNQLSSEVNSLEYNIRIQQNKIDELKDKNRQIEVEMLKFGS